jgi:hypothetical protein
LLDIDGEADMTRGLLRFLRGNTIALLALFVALGGTTYAATALPKNSVGTKQLKKDAVTNPKIKNGAVTGAKVADNSIKGADVLESSLGKVLSATQADSATSATNATNATHAINSDQLGGSAAANYQHRLLGSCPKAAMVAIGPGGEVACTTPVMAVTASPQAGDPATGTNTGHGLQVTTVCHDGANVLIAFQNIGSDNATLNWIWSNATPTISASGVVVNAGNEYDVSFAANRIEGQFIFANGAGNTTVSLHAYDGTTFCETRGTAEFGAN